MSRKIGRSMLKAQYKRFCEAWDNEKRFQRMVVESGGADLVETDGIKQIAIGEQRQNLLGKKPTFSMWHHAYKNKLLEQPTPGTDTKKVEVSDTEW